MIEQDLYLELLELFDLIAQEPLFVKYQQLERAVLNNQETQALINKYNDLSDEQNRIDYKVFQDEIALKQAEIKKELDSNELYQEYLETYEQCNEYLVNISRIIFKDIILVNEDGCCGCH